MIRAGYISFANSNPLFYALDHKKISHSATLVSDVPITINRMLQEGSLDIALISSAEFLHHRSDYILLSNLGVASTGPIMSVRLFYTTDPLQLDGNTVLVPSVSKTSIRLLQCLAKHYWKAQPKLIPFTCNPEELLHQPHPFLLIGDDCLRMWEKRKIHSLDLGEAWYDATNKSFVYSVIATRVDVFKKKPEAVVAFHDELDQSYRWAVAHRKEILDYSHEKSKCSKALLDQYFYRLEHTLTSKHFHGLNYYSTLDVQ